MFGSWQKKQQLSRPVCPVWGVNTILGGASVRYPFSFVTSQRTAHTIWKVRQAKKSEKGCSCFWGVHRVLTVSGLSLVLEQYGNVWSGGVMTSYSSNPNHFSTSSNLCQSAQTNSSSLYESAQPNSSILGQSAQLTSQSAQTNGSNLYQSAQTNGSSLYQSAQPNSSNLYQSAQPNSSSLYQSAQTNSSSLYQSALYSSQSAQSISSNLYQSAQQSVATGNKILKCRFCI